MAQQRNRGGRRRGGQQFGDSGEVYEVSRRDLAEITTQVVDSVLTGSAPQVFPEQSPRGGGRGAFPDPQANIRAMRIIEDQAAQNAYLAGQVASLTRALSRRGSQDWSSRQQQQGGGSRQRGY